MVIGNCLYACGLSVCLCSKWQESKSISPEKWVKSKVWSEGLKAKPHSSTNLARFKAQYEANPNMEGGFSLVGVARPDYYREGKTSDRRNITCGFC
jgi:hypothetical protein